MRTSLHRVVLVVATLVVAGAVLVAAPPLEQPAAAQQQGVCQVGQKCVSWSARHRRTSEGVGFPRSVATDDERVYVSGAWGSTFFSQDLHTIAYDARTGEKVWGVAYNGPADNSEHGWATAAAPDGSLAFTGGESKASEDSDYPDGIVIAYDGATGQQRWLHRFHGRYHAINAAKAMVVSHDSQTLYVAARVSENGMSGDFGTFAFDADTGERLWYSIYFHDVAFYDEPVDAELSPDGATLYVTGHSWGRHTSYDYATVAYDTATGERRWVARYDGDFARELVGGVDVSGDGETVFVSGSSIIGGSEDYATVAYDAATGQQLWVSHYRGPRAEDSHNDRAFDVAADPLNQIVVVTGRSHDEDTRYDYATVAYDAATGAELWVRRFHGPTVDGNDEASAVRISPGGSSIFVTGTAQAPGRNFFSNTDAHTIAYSRTGEIVWQGSYDDSGSEDDPLAMAMSTDGSWIYPAGRTMHVEGSLSTSTLAQFLTLGYETGVSEAPPPRPTPTASASPTPSESPSPSPSPSATESPSPTVSPTASQSPSPSPSTASPSPSPSGSPSQEEPRDEEAQGVSVTIAAGRDRTGFARPFGVSGTVEVAPHCDMPGSITLYKEVAGRGSPRPMSRSVAVSRDGTWSIEVRSRVSASYIAVADPGRSCAGASSESVRVEVRAKVTASYGKGCLVRGRVRANHAGTDMLIQRKVRGGWKTVDVAVLNKRSRFEVRLARCRGRHRAVWRAQDERNLGATAPIR